MLKAMSDEQEKRIRNYALKIPCVFDDCKDSFEAVVALNISLISLLRIHKCTPEQMKKVFSDAVDIEHDAMSNE